MLNRERFERSVMGQFHDFGNFSLQNTLHFASAGVGRPLQRKLKANLKRFKGGVFGRIKPTHRLVHFNWRASRTATEMPCLNPGIERKAVFFGRARQDGCEFRPV
jgi:hypothetical protein